MARIIPLVYKKKVAKKKPQALYGQKVDQSPVRFDNGLPEDLDEAVLLVYALAFGPLTKGHLIAALNRSGMTMPNGSTITGQKLTTVIKRLNKARKLIGSPKGPYECDSTIRWACFEQAREKGWLVPLGRMLQQINSGRHEYRSWGSAGFTDIHCAYRDVFLAMEQQDHTELRRLCELCVRDRQIGDVGRLFGPICFDPFRPAYLERLDIPIRYRAIYQCMHRQLCGLRLDHPIFDYARKTLGVWLNADLALDVLVCHLAERDILSGRLVQAQAILDAYPDENTHVIRGMLAFVRGDREAARVAFEQGLKRVGKLKRERVPYLQSFPAMLHTLLLVQSHGAKETSLARNWLCWADEDWGNPYKDAYRSLDALRGFHDNNARLSYYLSLPEEKESSLFQAAQWLMYLFFWAQDARYTPSDAMRKELQNTLPGFLDHCQQVGALWPACQLSRLMERLSVPGTRDSQRVQAFFDSSGAVDWLVLWPPREIWENQLQALKQLIGQSKTGATQAPESRTRRLGWKLVLAGEDEGYYEDDDDLYDDDDDEFENMYDDEGMFGKGDAFDNEPFNRYSSPIRAVQPVEQKQTKKGGWTGGRVLALQRLLQTSEEGLDYLTDRDKAVCAHIRVQHHRYRYGTAHYSLDPALALGALAGHENVFWEDAPTLPVEVVRCEPQLQVVPQGTQVHITLDPFPAVDGCNKKALIIKEGPQRLCVVEFSAMHRKVAAILGRAGILVPQQHKQQALQYLEGLAQHVAIQSDVAIQASDARVVPPDCTPHLRLQRYGMGLQADMVVVPLGQGAQRSFAPGIGNRHLIEAVDQCAIQTRRDLGEEKRLAQASLESLASLTEQGTEDYHWILEEPADALTLLEQLQGIAADSLQVAWPKGDPITVKRVSAQQVRLSVRSARDWFEVDGKVQVDEELVLQMRELLESLEKTEGRFIPIGDNQYVALTRQFRHELQQLGMTGSFTGKGRKLRMHPLAALHLDQWRDQVGTLRTDKAFDAHLERLRDIESYQPKLPSTLQARLRPYQQEGFVWLARLARWGVGACLADDMGLGKTVEALALVLHRAAQGPTLVVAPTSVCANWITEARRFAPTLNPIRFGLDDRGSRENVLTSLNAFDLLVCTYTLLQQEAALFKEVRFTTIVLDEAQAIKNTATKRSQAAMDLQGDFRMICTGTPIENRLLELWNLSRFINPGLLGSQKSFGERFVRPIETQSDTQAQRTLQALIRPFVLRRIKSQVLEDLPSRTEILRQVELTAEEQALHESLRLQALERLKKNRKKEPGKRHLQILAELMKLRRCCCNPRLVLPNCDITGSKLQVFAELVDELRENHHKALVFSQFVDHLALLRQHLDEQDIPYQYLDGKTPARTREKRINAFQNGQGDLFLISLKAGGLGLNLTAADYVIHMDPWWNPAVEDQASDRAHRIGQTRPVTIYRLVAEGTIEEKIVQLHHHKRDLADRLLQGTDSAHKLTAEELLELLQEA